MNDTIGKEGILSNDRTRDSFYVRHTSFFVCLSGKWLHVSIVWRASCILSVTTHLLSCFVFADVLQIIP